MFNHRFIIKFLIIPVIGVTVFYSITNVSNFAAQYHAGWVVWLLGASVGTANALAVYSLVISKTDAVRRASLWGIFVFGTLSAILQVALYLQESAPWAVALALGTFGPVAEGLLSWLHAALSEEQVKVPGKQASAGSKQASAGSKQTVNLQASAGSKQVQANAQDEVQAAVKPAVNLQEVVNWKDGQIAKLAGVSRQSVNKWRNDGELETTLLKKLPELAHVGSNGYNGHNGTNGYAD
jgi:hypothetical protein